MAQSQAGTFKTRKRSVKSEGKKGEPSKFNFVVCRPIEPFQELKAFVYKGKSLQWGTMEDAEKLCRYAMASSNYVYKIYVIRLADAIVVSPT